MATLSLSTLKDALAQLEQAVAFANKHRALGEMDYYRQFRTAAIQSFEYCYDIGQKLIRRSIELSDIGSETNRHLDFRDYMRVAAEFNLIELPESWVEYRQWRNETLHGYDHDVAEALFAQIPKAIESFNYTLAQLGSHAS